MNPRQRKDYQRRVAKAREGLKNLCEEAARLRVTSSEHLAEFMNPPWVAEVDDEELHAAMENFREVHRDLQKTKKNPKTFQQVKAVIRVAERVAKGFDRLVPVLGRLKDRADLPPTVTQALASFHEIALSALKSRGEG